MPPRRPTNPPTMTKPPSLAKVRLPSSLPGRTNTSARPTDKTPAQPRRRALLVRFEDDDDDHHHHHHHHHHHYHHRASSSSSSSPSSFQIPFTHPQRHLFDNTNIIKKCLLLLLCLLFERRCTTNTTKARRRTRTRTRTVYKSYACADAARTRRERENRVLLIVRQGRTSLKTFVRPFAEINKKRSIDLGFYFCVFSSFFVQREKKEPISLLSLSTNHARIL